MEQGYSITRIRGEATNRSFITVFRHFFDIDASAT